MGMIKKSNASVFLLVNSFLWGSSYVWSKMLLGYLPRYTILLLCSLGGLISTLFFFRSRIKTVTRAILLPAVLVSLFSILSNTCFILALQYTSSSNAAFIVQLSVILTPLLMAVIEKKLPRGRVVLSASLALCGLFLMTCNFDGFSMGAGDLLALGNALFFSMHLIGLNYISKKVKPVQFTIVYHITNTVGFLVLALLLERQLVNLARLGSVEFTLLAAVSITVTVVTVLVQSTAIRYVRPEKATLIYTFEPLAAMLLALVFIGEKLQGLQSLAGCMLLLVSVLLHSYRGRTQKSGYSAEVSTAPSSIEVGAGI
jgi:drug/metabolite transporter (DMT)-like permease